MWTLLWESVYCFTNFFCIHRMDFSILSPRVMENTLAHELRNAPAVPQDKGMRYLFYIDPWKHCW